MNNEKEIIQENNTIHTTIYRTKAASSFSTMTNQLLCTIASFVTKEDVEAFEKNPCGFARYTLDANKFYEFFGYQKYDYRYIHNALRDLQKTVVKLPFEFAGGRNLIPRWSMQTIKSNIDIWIPAELLKIYYDSMAGSYNLGNMLLFTLPNTFRFYELFIWRLENDDTKTFEISLEELQSITKTEDKPYKYFKKNIMTAVLSEINNPENHYCNIRVEYEEITEGRKVISLKFTVQRKKEIVLPEINIKADLYTTLDQEQKEAYDFLLTKVKIHKNTIEASINSDGPEIFMKKYQVIKKDFHKKTNSGAWGGTILRGNLFGEESESLKQKNVKDILSEPVKEEPIKEKSKDNTLEKLESLTPGEIEFVFKYALMQNDIRVKWIQKYDSSNILNAPLPNKEAFVSIVKTYELL